MDEHRLLELLDAHLDGALDEAGYGKLNAVLSSSAEARRAYWEYLQQHSLVRELLMEARGRSMALAPARSRRRQWLPVALGAAAALALAAGFYFALVPGRAALRPAGRVAVDAVLYAPEQAFEYGQVLRTVWERPVRVRLADRSVLTIDPESRVSVTERRRVSLVCGAVRARVQPEEQKPFEVRAEGTTVRALGTEFVVHVGNPMREEGKPVKKKLVSVVVISGAVLLANRWGELRLTAGQAAASEAGAKPAVSEIAEKVRKLIALLGHKDFAVREKASKELAELADKHGAIVVPLCEAAMKTAKDAEVRDRLKAFKDPGARRGPVEILVTPGGEGEKPKPLGWRPAVGSGMKPGIHCSGNVAAMTDLNDAVVPGFIQGYGYGLLGCADVDGDGSREVLVYKGKKGPVTLHAFKAKGGQAAGFPKELKAALRGGVAADINGDGKVELIALVGDSVHVCDLDGKALEGFPVKCGGALYKSLAVEDLTGDGKKEIIVTRWMQRELKVWDPSGKPLKGFPVTFPKWKDNVMYTLAFASADKGYKRKHILTLHKGNGLALVNGFGRFPKGWPVSVEKAGLVFNYGGGGKVCGDVTGDGIDEIFALVGPKQGGGDWRLLALDRSGKPLEGFPRPWSVVSPRKAMFGGGDLARGLKMSFGDVDGDGKKEAAWADAAAYLHVARADGTELEGYPRPVRHGNYQAPITKPVLWDADGDKCAEIFYLTYGAEGEGHTLQVLGKGGKDRAKELGFDLTIGGHAVQSVEMEHLKKGNGPALVLWTKPIVKGRNIQKWHTRQVMGFTLKPKK